MKKITAALLALMLGLTAMAQTDTAGRKSSGKILVVPYPSMMYFSDADADIARFSKTDEQRLRNQMRLMLEKNVHQQLLSSFNAVSLISATSLNGEEDLKRIYASTQFYTSNAISNKKGVFSSNLFRKKEKKQAFYVNDSATMVGEIMDPNLNSELYKKHHHDYTLYITQFEINTSNKNSIEWMKQQYSRSYVVHYNLWDNKGKLVLAETLTINAEGENELKTINEKYLALMATKLKEILASSVK